MQDEKEIFVIGIDLAQGESVGESVTVQAEITENGEIKWKVVEV